VSANVFVGQQRKRRYFSGTMARYAVSVDQRSNVMTIGWDLFNQRSL
jgi:hypothetical protein